MKCMYVNNVLMTHTHTVRHVADMLRMRKVRMKHLTETGAAMNALTTVGIICIVEAAIRIIENVLCHTLNQGKNGFVPIVIKKMMTK